MSDRDVAHSDLVEIAKRNGDFRKNYGVLVWSHSLSAFDKCRPPPFVLVASLDSNSRSCVGLLVAVNGPVDGYRTKKSFIGRGSLLRSLLPQGSPIPSQTTVLA